MRLAARKASDESIARMKEIHREMEDRLKRYAEGEYIPMKEFRKLDIAFHKAVIEGCENQIISRSLPMFLATCTEWYSVWTSLDFGKVLESFRRYHRKILEAVESHHADSGTYAGDHRYLREQRQKEPEERIIASGRVSRSCTTNHIFKYLAIL